MLSPLYGALSPLGGRISAPDPNADLKALVDAYWKLDEFSDGLGSVVRVDSGPNALHLSDPSLVASGVGHVYSRAPNFVSASNDYLNRTSDDAALRGGNRDYSVVAWANLSSTGDYQCLGGRYRSATFETDWLLYLEHNAGSPRAYVAVRGGGPAVSAAGSFSYGSWHMVGMRHTISNNRHSVRIDGGAWVNVDVGGAPYADNVSEMAVSRPGDYLAGQRCQGLVGPFAKFGADLTEDQWSRLWNGGAGLALY
jgi:hypothetical protein